MDFKNLTHLSVFFLLCRILQCKVNKIGRQKNPIHSISKQLWKLLQNLCPVLLKFPNIFYFKMYKLNLACMVKKVLDQTINNFSLLNVAFWPTSKNIWTGQKYFWTKRGTEHYCMKVIAISFWIHYSIFWYFLKNWK